ncbi:FCS-Like Zinc finger 10-like [Malania oleifera]|uniref:FCS-Like Zinc finger 10-like n=1 Tax=Malania oleifera TaxID=397392 RepID=UPI0025AE899A|nr:FCS-Like Zinc finger 10-like [Malania oleifera]
MGNQIAGFGYSDTCYQSDKLSQRHGSISFFGITGLLVWFSSKVPSDLDSVRSPTSLHFTFLSNLSNPFISFRSQRSPSQSSSKRWNCSKVGLSIIDSLTDETEPLIEALDMSESKTTLIRPQYKISIHNSSSHFYESLDSSAKTNLLPKNTKISSHSQPNSPKSQLDSSDVVFKIGEMQLKYEPLLDFCNHSSPPTIFFQNPNWSPKNFCSDNSTSTTTMNLHDQLFDGDLDCSLSTKQSSVLTHTGSGHSFVGSFSKSEMQLSEDYTCIISHGPNPKTTHIFGDYILNYPTDEVTNFDEKKGYENKLPQAAKLTYGSTPDPSDNVLSFCYSCKKKMEERKDIYMHSGNKAFCSSKCCSEETFVDEGKEKSANDSSASSPKSSCHEDIVFMGMPAVTYAGRKVNSPGSCARD